MADNKRYNLNERIRANELRVITATGENLGVMPRIEALQKAREAGMDLVEIGPLANPPVAKILDFKKFLYEERKKQSAAKAHSKQTELKEFKFGPHISSNDLSIRVERARGFLKEKNRVKFTVAFMGRQAAHPEIGREKLEQAVSDLADVARAEEAPKFVNNKTLTVTLLPR